MYVGNGCLQKTPLSRDWMRAWTGSVWNMAVITLSRRRRLSISGEMYFNSICGMHFQSRCCFRKLLFLKVWTEKRVGPKIVPCGAPYYTHDLQEFKLLFFACYEESNALLESKPIRTVQIWVHLRTLGIWFYVKMKYKLNQPSIWRKLIWFCVLLRYFRCNINSNFRRISVFVDCSKWISWQFCLPTWCTWRFRFAILRAAFNNSPL